MFSIVRTFVHLALFFAFFLSSILFFRFVLVWFAFHTIVFCITQRRMWLMCHGVSRFFLLIFFNLSNFVLVDIVVEITICIICNVQNGRKNRQQQPRWTVEKSTCMLIFQRNILKLKQPNAAEYTMTNKEKETTSSLDRIYKKSNTSLFFSSFFCSFLYRCTGYVICKQMTDKHIFEQIKIDNGQKYITTYR